MGKAKSAGGAKPYDPPKQPKKGKRLKSNPTAKKKSSPPRK